MDIPVSPPGSAKTLIPDEPTNHPLVSLTALNNGLIAFPEVLLLASRDH